MLAVISEHYIQPWQLTFEDNGWSWIFFNSYSEAAAYAAAHGMDTITVDDDYIDSLKPMRSDDLIAIGIEPERAEALTCMGEEAIETDGNVIWLAMNYEYPIAVADFVRDTNAADFDYESGYWAN